MGPKLLEEIKAKAGGWGPQLGISMITPLPREQDPAWDGNERV